MIVPKLLLDTVSFLYVQHGDYWEEAGTAFHLIIKEEDNIYTYIVTCKHVIDEARKVEPNRDIFMRLNRSDGPGVDYVQIESDWVYHDSKDIDIAIASLVPSGRPLDIGAFDAHKGILTRDEQKKRNFEIPLGYEVVFIGLFQQFKGEERNFPIVRQGKVALLTNEKIPGIYGKSDYYLIEGQGYPGNSGSPVFTPIIKTGNQQVEWKIWGILQGFYPNKQKIQRDVRYEGAKLWSHFGISTVTPIDFVLDILNKEVFVNQRKEKINAGKIIL